MPRRKVLYLVPININKIYANPITICGSYTRANNCRKNNVSLDGCTNFFSSLIFDVWWSDEVKSFIGNLLLRFLFLLSITNRKRVYYAKLHIYFYVLIMPDLSSSSCAMIFFLLALCIHMQKTMSRIKVGKTSHSWMPMFITMASYVP